MTKPAYNGAWPKVRLTILERDGYRCRIQGPGCAGKANTVDHIIPVTQGGARLDPRNLRAACAHCNYSRGDGTRTRHYATQVTPSRTW